MDNNACEESIEEQPYMLFRIEIEDWTSQWRMNVILRGNCYTRSYGIVLVLMTNGYWWLPYVLTYKQVPKENNQD